MGDTAKRARGSDTLYDGQSSHDVMFGMVYGHVVAQVVHCAALFSLPEHLALRPKTARQIAETEQLDADATFRLMRACAAFGILRQDGELFGTTPLLETLRKDDPQSLRNISFVQAGHGHWSPWGRLDEAIRTGLPQAKSALGMSIWQYYASPEGEAEGLAFTGAVTDLTNLVLADALRLIDTRSTTFAVDIGGAAGGLLLGLAQKNPKLHGAVLDLPHVIETTRQAIAAIGLEGRVFVVPGDFLKEVPPADLYLLKHIICDWDDTACAKILRNCLRAMNPGGRLIIIDLVMPEQGSSRLAAYLDLTMLTMLGAKQRTQQELRTLLAKAGFRLRSATPTNTPFSVLEAIAA